MFRDKKSYQLPLPSTREERAAGAAGHQIDLAGRPCVNVFLPESMRSCRDSWRKFIMGLSDEFAAFVMFDREAEKAHAAAEAAKPLEKVKRMLKNPKTGEMEEHDVTVFSLSGGAFHSFEARLLADQLFQFSHAFYTDEWKYEGPSENWGRLLRKYGNGGTEEELRAESLGALHEAIFTCARAERFNGGSLIASAESLVRISNEFRRRMLGQ